MKAQDVQEYLIKASTVSKSQLHQSIWQWRPLITSIQHWIQPLSMSCMLNFCAWFGG